MIAPGCAVQPEAGIAPNALQREFEAAAPDQCWEADFAYIWTLEWWLILAVVLDLYPRRVVGWSMQPRMTWELVADALLVAVWGAPHMPGGTYEINYEQ